MEEYSKVFELFGQLRKKTTDIFDECSVEADPTLIDLKRLEDKEHSISKMTEFYTGMSVFMKELETRITACKKQYDDELQRMGNFLRTKKAQVTSTNDVSVAANAVWNGRRILGRPVAPPPGFGKPPAAPVTPANTALVKYAKVPIVDAYHLMAIRVPSFSDVQLNGELYYVENANHFAFKIANVLFHGNIGNIYTSERDPMRIKNCKFRNSCSNKECTYYHDPVNSPGSQDIRNFIASSWQYASPHCNLKMRKMGRRFGSRENVASDLPLLSDEEVVRYQDQTAHDVLCTMLINRYHEAKS